MALSAEIINPEKITKIDFGAFSEAVNSFIYTDLFPKLQEMTIRNTNLITFVDGFSGSRLNLSNSNSQPILLIAGGVFDCAINQAIIGSGRIRKIGSGKLSLKNTNTYSGQTEISDGILEIETGVIGNGNYSASILNNFQLSVNSPTAQIISGIISGIGAISVAGNLTLTNNNTYSGSTSVISGGTLSISRQTSGSISTSSILNAGVVTFAGTPDILVPVVISGIGEIVKNGSSRLTFSGNNAYTGKTTINAGILLFAKIASLYSGVPLNWTKDKIIVNSGGTFAINVGGTGEFTATEVSQILLLFSLISNNGFRSGSNIAFDTTNASGSSFTISNTIPDSSGTGSGPIGVLKLGPNQLVLAGINSFTGQLAIREGTLSVSEFNSDSTFGPLGSGTLPISIGLTAEARIFYTGTTAATSNKKIIIEANGAIIENVGSLELTSVVSGTGSLKKAGAGTLTLSGVNSFEGSTAVNAGVLTLRSDLALGSTAGSVVVATDSALQLQNSITIPNKTLTINGVGIVSGGALRNVSGDNHWQGNLIFPALTTLRIGVDAGSLRLSGILSGNPTTLIFLGNVGVTSTIILSGANTFTTNPTLLGNIILLVNSIPNSGINSPLGTSSTIVFGTGGGSSGTILYAGTGDVTNKVINLATTTGTTTLDHSGTGLLRFTSSLTSTGAGSKILALRGSTSGIGEIAGVIVDNSTVNTTSITKSGTGSWILSGANTFSGTTTISGGYLIAANAAALGTIATATTVNSGGSLQIQGGITLNAEPLILSGTGVANNGALANLSGTNSLSGAITLNADARINSISGALTISGAINGTARTLTCGGAGTLTLSGIITLTTGGIVYDGAGVLILSNANSYTGATTISNGAVRVSNASALGTSGTITVNSTGQLEILGAITFARAVVIDGIGATLEGALVNRSGNNTFSGAITFGAGTTAEIGCASGILTLSGNITGTGKSIIFDVASGAEITSTGQIALTVGTSQGNLNKQGVGTLTISGSSNTYAGLTTVSAGILRITSLSSFGTSSGVIVADGATLQIQPTVAGTFSKLTTISGNGVSSQGALNNTALNNTIGSGVLQVGSTTANRIASATTLTLTINGITRNESLLFGAAAPLTFGGAGTITLSGAISTTGISGSSSLTKVDAGTLNLGNFTHNYNGSTTISAGTLTRVVTNGSTTATGTFTSTTLAVAFTAIPAVGSTWKFFPADTTNTYATVSLTGATGRTGTYNRTNSTLTIS